MAILMCMWMIWPYFSDRAGFVYFGAFLIVWIYTSDFRWLLQKWPLDLLFLGIWLITFIPYILTGNFRYGYIDSRFIQITFILFIVGAFINHYYMHYKKDYVMLGRISFLALTLFFVGSIQTYIGLEKYPLASRMLATGAVDPLSFKTAGIGGFGFVYSGVFIGIVCCYLLFSKLYYINIYCKMFTLVTLVSISMMVIKASYTIAVMILFTGIISVLFIKGKKTLFFLIFLLVFFLLFFPKELIGYFLLDIAELFRENDTLNTKLSDLAQGFIGSGAGEQTAYRSELYLQSFKTFLANPLFGIYGPLGSEFNAEVGEHSGWLDLMAYYGLFGALPLFIGVFLNFKKNLSFYSGHPFLPFLLIAQTAFVVFGFINPVIYIYQLGFVLFMIAPTIPFLPYAFSRNKVLRGRRNQ
ncbi:hypothetical protein [Bacillus sp. Hm123]|uniref:hypothetical protein n=1 Tax=Bacillus sp. Hm123 TaxID=3450745 RepID=UPI003F42A160